MTMTPEEDRMIEELQQYVATFDPRGKTFRDLSRGLRESCGHVLDALQAPDASEDFILAADGVWDGMQDAGLEMSSYDEDLEEDDLIPRGQGPDAQGSFAERAWCINTGLAVHNELAAEGMPPPGPGVSSRLTMLQMLARGPRDAFMEQAAAITGSPEEVAYVAAYAERLAAYVDQQPA